MRSALKLSSDVPVTKRADFSLQELPTEPVKYLTNITTHYSYYSRLKGYINPAKPAYL